MIRRTVRKAFTLVEILIVVVILGILAAIVVPQFTNATQDAQSGNLKAQLSSLNRQIELYRARNNGQFPGANATDAVAFWTDLIGGGYIKTAPVNPAYVGGGAAAAEVDFVNGAVTGVAGSGWAFNLAGNGVPGDADYIAPGTLFASHFNETTGQTSTTVTD
jgi:prepilin-type N-terminal cleavage/methylation domain-containing protein